MEGKSPNHLLFVRARHTSFDPEEISAVKDRYWVRCQNTFVCEMDGDPPDLSEMPAWVDFCELLEIGFDISACKDTFDDDGAETPSEFFILSLQYNMTGIEQTPAFGRKMLLVCFNDGANLERECPKIERKFTARQVWHGDDFRGFCFVDTRKCDNIIGSCEHILERANANDFLIVEPLHVIGPTGLSQLQQWLGTDWKSFH